MYLLVNSEVVSRCVIGVRRGMFAALERKRVICATNYVLCFTLMITRTMGANVCKCIRHTNCLIFDEIFYHVGCTA